MRDGARLYIQQNLAERRCFRTNFGYQTGFILASGRGIPRAVHDPSGVCCAYARIIRVEGREVRHKRDWNWLPDLMENPLKPNAKTVLTLHPVLSESQRVGEQRVKNTQHQTCQSAQHDENGSTVAARH